MAPTVTESEVAEGKKMIRELNANAKVDFKQEQALYERFIKFYGLFT